MVMVTNITFPDSSLGCSQPGMVYTQVIQEGQIIQLQANGQLYEYHQASNYAPFLCKNPPTSQPKAP